jgi:NodT family efflux transporter outer membrane factor (OMF) lipoprotein
VNYRADASLLGERFTANGIFPPPIGGSSFYLGDASLGVSYTRDWWGHNRDLIRAATGDTRASRAEAAAARLVIAASVADAYFAWADIRARLDIARKLADLRRESLKLAQSRLGNGLDSLLPVREAKQQLAQAKDLVHALEYLDRSWRYRMAALTGAGPDRADTLPAPRLAAAQPPLPAHLPLDWLARRPDVAALRWRTEAASARSAAAKADFYPNVDLTLLVGLQSESLTKWLAASSLNGSAGPAIHIPWFNTHTLQARLGAREAQYAAAVEAYNHDVLRAAEQVANGYALLASLKQRAQIQARALDEAQQIQSLQQSRYRNGLTDRIQIVDADITTLNRRLTVTELQAARLRASVALYQALGGGYGSSQDGDHGTPE